MNKRLQKYITHSVNISECISGAYILLMFTLQLFIFGPEGYRNITLVKYISFLSLAAVFILLSVIYMIRNRSKHIRSRITATEVLIVVYALLTLLSALVSEFIPDTLIGANRREGALSICIYCILFLLISRNAWAGKWVVYSLAAVVLLYSLVCVLQLFCVNIFALFPDGLTYYDAGDKYSGEFLGTLGNAGLTAGFLCLAAAILIVYVAKSGEKERLWLIIGLAAGAAILVISKIAAGILGLMAGIYISIPFIFTKGKRRIFILVTEGILLAAFFVLVYLLEFENGIFLELHNVLHGRIEDSFGSSRIFIWRNTLPLIAERPLLGGGPDTLAQRIGVIFETIKEDGTVRKATIDAAHNEYLNIAVCQGIPALLAYTAAAVSTLFRYIRFGTDDALASALAAGIICYLIQAFFGISVFILAPYFWIIWALLECRLKLLHGNYKISSNKISVSDQRNT